jgi:hypothetical protein
MGTKLGTPYIFIVDLINKRFHSPLLSLRFCFEINYLDVSVCLFLLDLQHKFKTLRYKNDL